MTSRGKDSARLPVEVWRLIAGHMSTIAWARVSRTCKAMHSVQPEQISMGVRSGSALAWVQTHWGQASTLELNWWRNDFPWVMAHNAASLTSLKHLELRLLQERNPATAMLLTWLLAQAPQLQLLYMSHPIGFVVPPIRNLSHLIMHSTEFTAASVASIRQLRKLQTLRLGRTTRDPEIVLAGLDLDLASLPQLSNVCLDSVSLDYITLPKQCSLHLLGDDAYMSWDDIAKHEQLRSVDLRVTVPELDQDSPPFLLEWKCSILDWWEIGHLGVVSSPVEFDAAHFCRLTHLRLSGDEIHIHLPQELHLQVLIVEASLLSITCTNPQEQAKRLQQLRVEYHTLQNTDVSVLVGAMCGLGAIVSKLDDRESESDADPDGRHGLLVSYRREPVSWKWKCPCGACLLCLRHI